MRVKTLCLSAVVLLLMLLHCAVKSPGKGSASPATSSDAKTVSPRDSAAASAQKSAVADSGVKGENEAELLPAAQLMIRACDNYLSVNRTSAKAPEVATIKAATYYNNRMFTRSRQVYQFILDSFPKSMYIVESMRMIAQSFYEEKQFDRAQEWYRKLRDAAPDGGDKKEAVARIAESNYRLGESFESQQLYKEAAEQFEKVALEFPEASIADIALFNAGLAYEKLTDWTHAILMFQRLSQKYLSSALLPKAAFRTAKCHEKLSQWDLAAQSYLRVIASFPRSDLAPASLYNAGFCFENAGKLQEAAITFEKVVQLYPKSDDAADVLFKAGEIYGQLKDWASVTRVNQLFSERFGSDANRAVQAMCMVGIAQYMQNQEAEALAQLSKTIAVYNRLNSPGTANKYYAAKAQYTIAEINQASMNKVELNNVAVYRERLKSKSELLDRTVEAYSKVVSYGLVEWTTRSVFQIGLAYEDFGLAVLGQQRPKDLALDKQLGLELGIAKAAEDYFVLKAMRFHEQNIKLGIKEKVEDKYTLESRRKLLYLPLAAGKNYLQLVEVARAAEDIRALTGFALIAKKLEMLQRIAPFQERAIELFLSCLEKGALYQETNEFFKEASTLITGITSTVGETYAEVATIAREAPIPEVFDPYEAFVYKTKLLQQIQGYEDQAVANYLKTLKISDAYKINDAYVSRARERTAGVLFMRGRCYDLLGIECVAKPPYPAKIDAAQREEYTGRFEELSMKLQEQSSGVYRSILEYAKQNYAAGDFVTHAYVRLYQGAPREFGVKIESVKPMSISSGPQWKISTDTAGAWNTLDFDDGEWKPAQKGRLPAATTLSGFPAETPVPMWSMPAAKDSAAPQPSADRYFRRIFYSKEKPHRAELYAAATGRVEVFFNGELLPSDTSARGAWNQAKKWDLMGRLRDGKNVVATRVAGPASDSAGAGFCPFVYLMVTQAEFLPKPPGFEHPMAAAQAADGTYRFPFVRNFSFEEEGASETVKN